MFPCSTLVNMIQDLVRELTMFTLQSNNDGYQLYLPLTQGGYIVQQFDEDGRFLRSDSWDDEIVFEEMCEAFDG